MCLYILPVYIHTHNWCYGCVHIAEYEFRCMCVLCCLHLEFFSSIVVVILFRSYTNTVEAKAIAYTINVKWWSVFIGVPCRHNVKRSIRIQSILSKHHFDLYWIWFAKAYRWEFESYFCESSIVRSWNKNSTTISDRRRRVYFVWHNKIRLDLKIVWKGFSDFYCLLESFALQNRFFL